MNIDSILSGYNSQLKIKGYPIDRGHLLNLIAESLHRNNDIQPTETISIVNRIYKECNGDMIKILETVKKEYCYESCSRQS